MSLVGILKRLMSVFPGVHQFFVFVGILEKGDSNALYKRNHNSCAISQLTFRVSNTYTSPFTIKGVFLSVNPKTDFRS